MADALARLSGTMLSGVVRDAVTALFGSLTWGYVTVFLIQAAALLASLLLLRRINVSRFRDSQAPSLGELSALIGEARS
jgi:hypothetical protein